MKITALSSCCVDLYPELDKVYVGGNSVNFATQCKLSGIANVSVIGALGNDKHAELIENHLDKREIDRSRLYRIDSPTASNKIFIDKYGDRYFKADSWQGGAFDRFRLTESDYVYLESQDIVAMPAGDPNLDLFLKRRKKEQLVVIDFLDYHPIEFIENRIKDIDISFLSAKEEMFDDLKVVADKSGKMIVATLGAKGSVAFYKEKCYRMDALQVEEVVDTTGCGDAYQAAFVIEWFKSKNIKQAMYKGSCAAAKVLLFKGGVE